MKTSSMGSALCFTVVVAAGCGVFGCMGAVDDATVEARSSALVPTGTPFVAFRTAPVTVDGVIAPGEWDDASIQVFSVCSGANPGLMYVKNDATNLYVAVVVNNARWRFNGPPGSGNDFLNLYFDNNNDGVAAIGDSYWDVRGGDGLTIDGFNPNGITYHMTRDIDAGGTIDLTAAATHTNPVFDAVGTYTAEYRGPLDSADDAHDFSLALGQRVGFNFAFATTGNCTSDYYWPSSSLANRATILVAGPGAAIGQACVAGADCSSALCVDGVCCSTACGGGDPTDCQACSIAAGGTADGSCLPLPPARICRASADACDQADHCDGAGTTCPVDQLSPAGQTCRPSLDVCDVAEVCSGLTPGCPLDLFASGGVCRPAAGACDIVEACTGAGAACPTDGFAPAGTTCYVPVDYCESSMTCSGGTAVCPIPPPPPVTCDSTPAGAVVEAELGGGDDTLGGVSVTFTVVTSGGATTVTESTGGTPPPTGYRIVGLGGVPHYYDINTTSTYVGLITVCIHYDPTQVVGPESALRMFHDVGGAYVDVTILPVDTANDIVCGSVSSLSPFIVAEPLGPIFKHVPSTITIHATSRHGAKVKYAKPRAVDAVDGVRPVTCAPPSGATFPIGKTTVTCTASDRSGNTSTATFTVWVKSGRRP